MRRPFPPEPDSPDHLLAQVCHLHHGRAHTLFDAIGLGRGQPPVLRSLWEQDGQTHSELAAQLRVTPATMTRLLQRMETAGFVERRPDPDDDRVSRVFLTRAGRAIRSKIEQAFRAMEADTFAGFDEAERAGAARYLARIRDNLVRAAGDQATEPPASG